MDEYIIKQIQVGDQSFRFCKDDELGKVYRICSSNKESLFNLNFLDNGIVLKSYGSHNILASIQEPLVGEQKDTLKIQLFRPLTEKRLYSLKNINPISLCLNIDSPGVENLSYIIENVGGGYKVYKHSNQKDKIARFEHKFFQRMEGKLRFKKHVSIDVFITLILAIGISIYIQRYKKRITSNGKFLETSDYLNNFYLFPLFALNNPENDKTVQYYYVWAASGHFNASAQGYGGYTGC